MDWFKDKLEWVKNHFGRVLAIPAALASLPWLIKLLQASSDGVITHAELDALTNGASALQVAIALVVLVALKYGKK